MNIQPVSSDRHPHHHDHHHPGEHHHDHHGEHHHPGETGCSDPTHHHPKSMSTSSFDGKYIVVFKKGATKEQIDKYVADLAHSGILPPLSFYIFIYSIDACV